MIYKFEDEKNLNNLEVSILDKKLSLITIKKNETDGLVYSLDTDQLYDLIGALHIIKNKIEKEVTDAK